MHTSTCSVGEECVKNFCDALETLLEFEVPDLTLANSFGDPTLLVKSRVPFVVRRSGFEKVANDVLLTYALKAEKLASTSFLQTYKFANQLSLECLRGVRTGLQPEVIRAEILQAANDVITAVKRNSAKLLWNDVMQQVSCCVKSPKLLALVSEITDLSGAEGKVTLELSQNATPSIELLNGHTFRLEPAIELKRQWRERNVRCIFIDGTVETVSELHKVLQHFSDTKEPGIVFAREFHPEVLHTMKVNFDRGTLNLLPVKVPVDIRTINMLNDLAVIAGSDVVSSLKGELISCINPAEHRSVDLVTVSTGNFTIVNSKMAKQVLAHVEELKSRKQGQEHAEMKQLFDDRIRCLTPNYVSVKIPETLNDDRDQLDRALRLIRTLVTFGGTLREVSPSSNPQLELAISAANLRQQISAGVWIASLNYGTLAATQLLQLAGVVINQ